MALVVALQAHALYSFSDHLNGDARQFRDELIGNAPFLLWVVIVSLLDYPYCTADQLAASG
jgi:hypothetical protein